MTPGSRLTKLLDLARGALCERGTPVNNACVEALVTPVGAIRRGRLRFGRRARITFLKEAMFAVDAGNGFLPFGRPGLKQETRLLRGACPVTKLKLGPFTIRQMVSAPNLRGRPLPVILVSFEVGAERKARFRIKCPDPIRPWKGAARFAALDRRGAGRELEFMVAPSRPAQAVFALIMGRDERDLAKKRGIARVPSAALL